MIIDNENNLYYIWLTQISGVGPIIGRRLLDKFKSPKKIYGLDSEDFLQVEGIGSETARRIVESKDLSKTRHIIKSCNDKGIKITIIDDNTFPESIKSREDLPIVLYYKGILNTNSTGVAIVGARRCTEYGKRVSVEAAEFLAKNNTMVISGMAKGIDSYAHTACLKAGGNTIAVLGHGVDICYPKEHSELMKKIAENGAVISEYPPLTPPKSEYFPKRNRIISALSNKILIAEAGEKSGSLITAEYAFKQKKEVFAVPGDIYCSAFKGSNKLISERAKIYLGPNQLLDAEHQNGEYKKINDPTEKLIEDSNADKLEQSIIKILKNNPLTLDEMILSLKIDKNELINVLFSMEINNVVRSLVGKYIL